MATGIIVLQTSPMRRRFARHIFLSYRVDSAMLQFIAASHDLTLRMPQEPLDTPFTLWEDGRDALAQFLKRALAP